jgi:hypothetical protein
LYTNDCRQNEFRHSGCTQIETIVNKIAEVDMITEELLVNEMTVKEMAFVEMTIEKKWLK